MPKRSYRGEAYWEQEQPEEARSGRVLLRWFAKAGKLQVTSLYKDRESGELRPGKVVTLDEEDLRLHPELLEMLARVVEEWREGNHGKA